MERGPPSFNPQELMTAMKRTLEQLAAFNQIAKALTSTLEVNEVLQLMMQKVSQLLEPESWSLLLAGDDGKLYFEICVGPAAEQLKALKVPVDEGIAGSVFRTGKGRLVGDVREDPDFSARFDAMTSFRTKSIIAVPLLSRGKSLGVIEIVNGEHGREFTVDDLRACAAIADFAAIAIENARNFKAVQELTLTDEHTGLFNARYLTAQMEKEIARAERFARPVSLIFFDLDNFKQVNDRHGHLEGSALLKAVGEVLTASVRSVDSCCRFGGDEFAVLLLETDGTRAQKLAEAIRSAIESRVFRTHAGEPVQVTASVGFASFPEHGLSARALLEAADKAMYLAKNKGKNSVAGAGPI